MSMHRKEPLAKGEIYHIYNRSIAKFKIFDHENEYHRMVDTLTYYLPSRVPVSFSRHSELKGSGLLENSRQTKTLHPPPSALVTLIAFCLMPTHFHILLRQDMDDGISIYIARVLNSYTKFFNRLHHRKGPLWEGRFENRHVTNDEYFLHLSRYIHLNPVTARLVDKAEDWPASSYREYISASPEPPQCTFRPFINLSPEMYKAFTEDRRDYQRQLATIKHLLIDE